MQGADTSTTRPAAFPRLRWAVWLAGFAMYTYLLVVPEGWLPHWLNDTVGQKVTDKLTVGKYAHAFAYGGFTIMTFGLPVRWRGWLICVLVLSMHGFLTEYVQTFVPTRHGRWEDVQIDHYGIAGGLILGGLGYLLWRGLSAGRRPDRVPAAYQVQDHAGREDQNADPL
jgi:VanZ family protein